MKKGKLYQYIYACLIFLYLFCPFIKIGGWTIYLPYFYLFSCFLLLLVVLFKYSSFSRIYLNFLLLYWLGGLWILFTGILNSNIDSSILFSYFTGTLALLAGYPIVKVFSKKIEVDEINFIIRSTYIAGLIHAFIMVLAFFWEPFRSLLYSIVPLGDNGQSFVENMIRSPGLTSSGGDSLSVIQSLSLIFGIYYFTEIKKEAGLFQSFAYLLSFLILFLSILLSARTGLIIIFIFLCWLFLSKLLRFILTSKFNSIFISRMFFFIIVVSITAPLSYNYLINSEYSRFARRAFELFINYTESGTVTTTSTDNLKQMYFLPKDKIHLIFGDGNFGRNESLPGISSDVGYVRMVFGVGLIGCFMMLLPLFYVLYLCVKYYDINKHLTNLMILMIFLVLIVNLKVYYYFEFREIFKILYLLLASLTILLPRKVID